MSPSRPPTPPRRLAALLLVVMVGYSAGCSSASPSPRVDGDTPSPIGVSPSSRGTVAAPTVLRSTLLRHDYVRLPVSSADLSNLVRVHGNTIEALTSRGAFEGQTYPARSTDDGGSWVIDGPQFNGGGASGGSQIDHLAASRDQTLIGWGLYGVSVKTRAAGQRHWRTVGLGEVRRATTRRGQLVVQTFDDTLGAARNSPGPTYVSSDDGLSWRRT